MHIEDLEHEEAEPMTEEELDLAAQAADDFADHRFQSEEY